MKQYVRRLELVNQQLYDRKLTENKQTNELHFKTRPSAFGLGRVIKQTVVLSVSAKFVLFANKKYLHVIMSAGVLNFNFNFRTILYNIIMHTFLTRELLRRCYDDSFSCNLSLNV